MNSRYVVATLVLAASCGGRAGSFAPVAKQGQALDQGAGPGDNEWKIYVVGYENGYLQSPQSTPPAEVYDYFKSYRPGFCKNGGHGPACTNNPVIFELIPLNVEGPPAPDSAYSPKVVKHFLDGENQLLAFINQSDMNAPSVVASVDAIQARQQAVFNRANFTEQVKQKKRDAKDYLVGKLKTSAAAVLGPEMAALADSKQKIRTIQALTNDYVKASLALAAGYQDLTAQYQAYRNTEGGTFDKVNAIAQSAADADLPSIAKLKQQLRDLSGNESLLPEQIVLQTARLSSELTYVQGQYDQGIAPLLPFMKEKAIAKLDETAVALRSLGEMYAYCLAREDKIQQALLTVSDGLNRRTQGLLAQATDQATRDTLVKTGQLRASSAYIADVNVTRDSLWKTLPKSTNLKLSYLSDKFDEMTAFLQREGLCSGSVPDYMQTGCNLMKPDFTKAHDWLTKTGPSTIRIQLLFMKNAGLPQVRIDAITAELAAGKARQAASDHDALLAISDKVSATDPSPDGGVPYVDESEDD